MCGRYVSEEDKSIDLAALYRAVRISHPDVTLKSGEIFPTETVPLLIGRNVTPAPAVWGFQRFDGKGVIINARAETAAAKPAFADAVRRGRCVIPATGYFEWTSSKEKHRFSHTGEELLYMAGLCRATPEGLRFVILTTPASLVPLAASVHTRMPLLLSASSVGDWLREPAFAYRCLQSPDVTAISLLDTRVG